jgi:2-methylcitrate dehydratase
LLPFANGAAFRYYDLNDFYIGTITTHPSDHIAPCLAVGEAVSASGRDLIVAIAYEVNCRLADTLDIFSLGWDTPVYSLPAVALTSGKLMGLDTTRMTEAVNIAINDHISMAQTRMQALPDWKGLVDGEASRNAVFAAMLARAGLTGHAPIFEGRIGFFKQVSGEALVLVDVGKFGGHGNPFRIHQCGMKAFPAVIYSQTAIEAAKAVAGDIGAGAPGNSRAARRCGVNRSCHVKVGADTNGHGQGEVGA